jgi:hypothetical protein
LVLTDPTGRKLVLSPQLHSKLYPHQVGGELHGVCDTPAHRESARVPVTATLLD